MLSWTVGRVKVTRVEESHAAMRPEHLFATATPEAIDRHRGGWAERFVDARGHVKMSIHSFVVESEGRRIVVDTCVGNDKERNSLPGFGHLQTPFLERLAEAGAPPDSVDTVVCTHLHFDHVGWNTTWDGDRWAPTFAAATYLFAGEEWEYWSEREARGDADVLDRRSVMADSLLPVFESDQLLLVDTDHRLTGEVALGPTPGHTPGHASLWISSEGHEAVITGDMIHHPLQIAEPTWCVHADGDQARAILTRRAFLERCASRGTLVLGTHFPPPTAGRIVSDGAGWRFAPQGPDGSVGDPGQAELRVDI